MKAAALTGTVLFVAVTLAPPAAAAVAEASARAVLAQDAGAGDEPDGPDGHEPDDSERREKNGKGKARVTVRGCLHGTTLGDVEAEEEDVRGLTSSLALRASREIRRRLKEYNRHQVEVTGVLTPAPRSPLSGRWGGTTVTVGGVDPRRSPAQQTQPAVASLEVESIESLSPSCP